ncbi:hypothetical protein POM88_024767 [Heracleum sosnowskyi]|uniref:Uncharacterized protein n=1 Tax=Heracleum sosnowskyi TaxID=360622 RepID=A0AAD8I3G3_9APIA|nr:hypothetical protein POM88_024767 [Heracleum sosnowskyi]
MAAIHFPTSTDKNLMNDGILFVTNNYSAILDKTKAPSEFHLIQDFLASSSIGFALTEPKAISAQAVMQIWSTATYTSGTSNTQPSLTFSYRNDLYEVTPTIVQRALHLGSPTSFTPFFSEAVLREFFIKIGYNGDMTRMGRLVRTKLRQEWNFFFDSIGKCFMNKSSNFDALTKATQNIGILLVPFRSTQGKQMFQGNVVYPEQVRQLLRQKLPTVYGLNPSTKIQRPDVATPSGFNPRTQLKQLPTHSNPTSDGSQQQSVVRHTRTLLPHPTDTLEKQGDQPVGMASKILASRRKHTTVVDTDDDDVPLSSIFKISSVDMAHDIPPPPPSPKRRRLRKSNLYSHFDAVDVLYKSLHDSTATDDPISCAPDSTFTSDTGCDPDAVPTPDANTSDVQPSPEKVVVSDSSPSVSPQGRKVDMSYDQIKRLEHAARKEIAETAS